MYAPIYTESTIICSFDIATDKNGRIVPITALVFLFDITKVVVIVLLTLGAHAQRGLQYLVCH